MARENLNFDITGKDRTARAFRRVRQRLQGLSQSFGGLKAQMGAALGVAGLGAFVKKAVDAGDRVQKLSTRLGASTEALSQYRHVAELSGVEFENLARGLERMQDSIGDAAAGTGQARKALDELGIDVQDLKRLSPEQQFELLADALNGVGDSADRMRLARDIFGRTGAELLQITAAGSEGIRRMREEADQLGYTLSQDQANAMAAANDAITRLKGAMMGLGTVLAVELVPAITKAADWLRDRVPAAIEAARAGFARIEGFIAGVKEWFGGLDPAIQDVVTWFANAFGDNGAIVAALTAFGLVLKGLIAAAGPIGLFITAATLAVEAYKNWDKIVAFMRNLYEAVKEWLVDKFRMAIEANIAAWRKIIDVAREVYEGIKTWLVDKFNALVERIGAAVDKVVGFFEGAYDAIVGHSWVPDLVDEIGRHFARLDGLMVAPAQEATERVSGAFRNLKEGASNSLVDPSRDAADKVSRDFERLAGNVTNSITGIIDGTTSAKDALRSLAKEALNIFAPKVGNWLGGAIGNLFGGGGGGGFAGVAASVPMGGGGFANPGAAMANAFGGFRAAGGTVERGKAYVVGEKGPELFFPGRSGRIEPNTPDGGGVSITNNITISSPVRNWREADRIGELIGERAAERQAQEAMRKRMGRL